jgi:hypothetical protein
MSCKHRRSDDRADAALLLCGASDCSFATPRPVAAGGRLPAERSSATRWAFGGARGKVPHRGLLHPRKAAASRRSSARGKPRAALAGARTAEAIVPAIEPDDCSPGVVRREATDVAASRCRHWDSALPAGAIRKGIVAVPAPARPGSVETNRPVEVVVDAQVKPDRGRSRLLSHRLSSNHRRGRA